MKKIFQLLIIFILFSSLAQSSTYVKRYPTDTAVLACTPSDADPNCAGGGGGSGNVGIGTAGRIPVYIASTTIGSPYIIVADSSGNVGIGTSSPTKLLTVGSTGQSTIDSSGNIATLGTYTQSGIGQNTVAGNLSIGAMTPVKQFSVGTGNTNYFDIDGSGNAESNGAGAYFQNGTSGRNIFNGKMSLGNGAATTYLLDLNGSNDRVRLAVGTGYGIFHITGTSKTALMCLNDGSPGTCGTGVLANDAVFGSDTAGINTDITAGSTATIFVNGTSNNVGIGSSNPGAKLDVNGTIRSTGFTASLPVCTDSSKNLTTSGCSSGSSQWQTIEGVGNVGISTTDVVGIGTTLATGAGLIVMNGNVGIGTWKPIGSLNVIGGNVSIGTTATNQYLNVGSAGSVTTISSSGALALGGAFTANGNAMTLSASNLTTTTGNIGIGTTFVTGTGGGGALQVMNGNVGIGTWIPGALFQMGRGSCNSGTTNCFLTGSTSYFSGGLQLNGGLTSVSAANPLFGNQDNSANGGASFVGGGSNSSHLILSSNNNSGTTDYMIFQTGASVERMRIDTKGNIGIGTSLQQGALVIMPNAGGGNVGIGTWLPSSLFDIEGAGNVSIGTRLPAYKFAVNGTAQLAGLTTSAGLQTAVLCLDANNQVISDSVACLASSAKFKNRIAPITSGLNEVLNLHPVTYYWNKTGNLQWDKDPNRTMKQYGFIAEEVNKIDPLLVVLDDKNMPRTFRYEQYTAVLTKAIQELSQRVEKLERKK